MITDHENNIRRFITHTGKSVPLDLTANCRRYALFSKSPPLSRHSIKAVKREAQQRSIRIKVLKYKPHELHALYNNLNLEYWSYPEFRRAVWSGILEIEGILIKRY